VKKAGAGETLGPEKQGGECAPGETHQKEKEYQNQNQNRHLLHALRLRPLKRR